MNMKVSDDSITMANGETMVGIELFAPVVVFFPRNWTFLEGHSK